MNGKALISTLPASSPPSSLPFVDKNNKQSIIRLEGSFIHTKLKTITWETTSQQL